MKDEGTADRIPFILHPSAFILSTEVVMRLTEMVSCAG